MWYVWEEWKIFSELSNLGKSLSPIDPWTIYDLYIKLIEMNSANVEIDSAGQERFLSSLFHTPLDLMFLHLEKNLYQENTLITVIRWLLYNITDSRYKKNYLSVYASYIQPTAYLQLLRNEPCLDCRRLILQSLLEKKDCSNSGGYHITSCYVVT